MCVFYCVKKNIYIILSIDVVYISLNVHSCKKRKMFTSHMLLLIWNTALYIVLCIYYMIKIFCNILLFCNFLFHSTRYVFNKTFLKSYFFKIKNKWKNYMLFLNITKIHFCNIYKAWHLFYIYKVCKAIFYKNILVILIWLHIFKILKFI